MAETRSMSGLYVQFYVQAPNLGSMPEFYVLQKIARVQCLGSILRLNVQAEYSGSISKFFGAKNIAQAQCSSSMFRLNTPDLSGIL